MPSLPERYIPVGSKLDGGMGSVSICVDDVLDRHVAIKRIHSTTHLRRMHDELAALLKMRSKHVVQVYDILSFPKDELGIVQEFIDGKDLFESHKIPASVTEYYKQLWQIASGISDIHALGVIHRDIKPNNMKTDPEGVIKIFDFGLARDDGPSASTVGFVGTPGFAAPELYAGTAKFTNAIDTYAFGATALYLATGNLPGELMKRPPAPSTLGYFSSVGFAISPELIASLDACLAKEAKDRPPMCEVRNLLARHLLFDRHQSLVVFSGAASYLNATNRTVELSLPSVGSVVIYYDGLDFRITNVSGEVLINNHPVSIGDSLPSACVVSLGGPLRRTNARKFITFDLSHPEIVL